MRSTEIAIGTPCSTRVSALPIDAETKRCDVAADATAEPVLISAQEYTLADLARVEHPVLARALHRILTEVEGTDTPLAAFDNAI